ncbi:MAG: sporulation transcriptional regulator SpoIIID [Clostridia bacterium]|nr:sporulation transcriptional regulator SpoIIID [Clostridia bacterium]
MVGQRSTIQQQYNRALQIAEFIIEGGHLVEDVTEEFRISKTTYHNDMRLLYSYGYGAELKRNQMLYLKTRIALQNEKNRRQREKRE